MSSLLRDVAGGLGVTIPSSYVGNTEKTAVQLLSVFNEAGRYLASAQDWRELTFESTVTTAAGTLAYSVATSPAFHHFVPASGYDRASNLQLIGPIGRAEYQRVKAWTSDGLQNHRVQFRATTADRATPQLVFASDPGGAFTIAYEYVTQEWLKTGSGYADTVASDTDEPVFDRYLMECQLRWRIRRALGEPFASELDEANRAEERLFSQQGRAVLRMSPTRPQFAENIPEGNWS